MNPLLLSAVSIGAALILGAIFTPIVIRLAHARGWIVAPRADRWHRKPTALMGGIAIYGAFMVAYILHDRQADPWILLAASVMFALGLYDDLKEVKPFVKLFGQIAVSLLLVFKGHVFGGGYLSWAGIPLTFLWVIGITNAINLLDNMDGLSAGISSIVALISAILALQQGAIGLAVFGFSLAGACFGFLFYNFNPARIFMGDSGSLFLGFSVAYLSLAIQHTARNSTGVLVLLIPIGLMAIPIMDTTLVTVRRILSGRRIDQGGRDHTSHRLVALGLSERQAVLLLYLISAIWGLVIFLLYGSDTTTVLLLIGMLTIFSVIFTMYLSSVRVYSETEEKLAYLRSRGQAMGSVFGLRFLLMHKKLILGISVDMVIVSLSFFMAARSTQIDLGGDFRLLGVFILLRILSFYLFDLYNRVWRYVATHELLGHLYAVLFSSAAVFIVNRVFGFGPRLTNSFFLTDFFVTLSGLIFSRLLWRALREYFDRTAASRKQRVLIYGAGDGGYILIREIIQNYRYGMSPVGFLDDDPAKRNMSIAGVRIFGGLEDLAEAVRRTKAEVVVTSMRQLDPERRARLDALVAEAGVALKRFEVSISEG
jgi:UDP-GlcNAc:undecaprenyl-phosphate/decaprenyl-phosphate GlcNAc-1-phosphate transferase